MVKHGKMDQQNRPYFWKCCRGFPVRSSPYFWNFLIYIIKLHALLRREQFLKYLNRTMEKRYHNLFLASLFMSQLCSTYFCPTIVAIVLIISMLSAKSWTTIYYVVIHLLKYFIVSWWKECFSWREGKWDG